MPIVNFPKGNGESKVLWRTQDGRLIRVGELEYTHLINIIEYLKKRVKALAQLGKVHKALYTEMWLLLMLAEKDKRNVTRNAMSELQDYIRDEEQWPKFVPSRRRYLKLDPRQLELEIEDGIWQEEENQMYEEIFGFENKWGRG